ncbi:hypothetical protein [Kitasatospora sp. NPDC002965]|uniref:hypothetical protein n=1 Tax=Kitasatospora sp. NPDC002965 TaxID=3154775 RepID=UPI0033A87774
MGAGSGPPVAGGRQALHERLRRVRISLEAPGRDSVPAVELQDALYGELDTARAERGPAPADD